MIIEDGTGKGYKSLVTEENRFGVDAISVPHITHESEVYGLGYIISTGFIPLTTTASFSGLLYIKNTDSLGRSFHIHHFRVCSGLCAAGSTLQVQAKIDATTGTLISDANAGTVNNMNTNFSANILDSVVYSASGDGKTVTDGTQFTQFINHAPGHSLQDYNGAIVLATNSSFVIEVKPEVAMTACIELIGYYNKF